MRKTTIFISAVLTTFALVMLYNVASAYRTNKNVEPVSVTTAAPTVTQTSEPTDTPAPTQSLLSPQEAAQLATHVIGNTNLLSAESSNINGVNAYKITFTNNDIVYVGLDGQILSVQVAPAVINATFSQAQPVKKHQSNHTNQTSPSANSGGVSFTGGGEHESEQGD